jgi:cytochrome c oxidase subunit 2
VSTKQQYDGLGTTYLIVAGIVFGIIALGFAFVLIRYRASRDPDRPPGETHENTPLEGGYMVLLVLVTAFLLIITFRTLSHDDNITKAAEHARHPLHVNVIAAQWNWTFEYAGTPKVVIPPPKGDRPTELRVPQGRPVLFTGRSQDVLHQFFVSEVRFKRQVWPDHTERWGMIFPDRGTFRGQCNWFCGLWHDRMLFTVVVMKPQRFDAWLARARRKATA